MQQVVLPSLSFSHPILSEPEMASDDTHSKSILPEEMLVHIFTMCLKQYNTCCLLPLSLTCRQFYRIISHLSNHLPYVLWTKFLMELNNINHRNQMVCIHPNLYRNMSRYELSSLSIQLWEKSDPKAKGLYTFMHLNFELVISQSNRLERGEIENNQKDAESLSLPTVDNTLEKLEKIHFLIERVLTLRRWRADNLRISKIPNLHLQALITKCQNHFNSLGRCYFFSLDDMQRSTTTLQNILDEGIFPRANNREQKTIYQLIINHLKANHTTRRIQCNLKTACQLIACTEDMASFTLLLGFFSHSAFFSIEEEFAQFCLYSLRKNGFYLPHILEHIKRFPADKQQAYQKRFMSTALAQNPKVAHILPII